jgi:hypothetical protein
VSFNLRSSDAGSGSAALEFVTVDSCTPGQSGQRTYAITSSAVQTVSKSSSGVVLLFSNLNITDETTPGKHGAIVVECSRFTMRVVVVSQSEGPHAGQVGFEVRDGDGKLVWSSGLEPLTTGSLSAA